VEEGDPLPPSCTCNVKQQPEVEEEEDDEEENNFRYLAQLEVDTFLSNPDKNNNSNQQHRPDPTKTVCPKIKIADMGLVEDANLKSRDTIQTRLYRSPESVLKAEHGAPSDIWSAACMLYELATGEVLFEPSYEKVEAQRHKAYSHFNNKDKCQLDLEHLHLFVGRLGEIPRPVAESGENTKNLFDRDGNLRSIALGNEAFVSLKDRLLEKSKFGEVEAEEFADFLGKMLIYDPRKRKTARQSLRHKFLK